MIIFAGKRMLPYRPHPDHLRKQAKTRLLEMRARQPDARLADAQRTLAQEYGYSSWGKLQAEACLRATRAQERPSSLTRRRRVPLVVRYREPQRPDSLLEQAALAETQSTFFRYGFGTSIAILFVFFGILTSVWTFIVSITG